MLCVHARDDGDVQRTNMPCTQMRRMIVLLIAMVAGAVRVSCGFDARGCIMPYAALHRL